MLNARLLQSTEGGERGEGEFAGTERFVVHRRLGAGGMGVVYEAYDRERGMAVALKTLRWADAQSIYRFKSEFRALADLEHRNLVRLGELFHERGAWFFTMELVPGAHFLAWVQGSAETRELTHSDTLDMVTPRPPPAAAAPLPVADLARLRDAFGQLVLGVSALHAAGKLHRDIKPTNVLVTPKGRVVLLDLGLVAEIERGLASDPDVVGTAGYMAPEQAGAPRLSPASDWYSVGVMLFEALTGRLPFSGPPLEMLLRKQREPAPRPSHLRAGVPEDLDELCAALLAREPEARPDGAALAHRLQLVEVGTRTSGPHPTGAPPPFVGRGAELASLRGALDEVAATGAVTLYVDGESGIGKTALVRRFLAGLADERPDVLVLAGRCYERESMPFKALDGIIDALARHLCRAGADDVEALLPADTGALARLFPVLLRVPAIARTTCPRVKSPLELRSRAFVALRAILSRLTAAAPLLLHIDDFQWADADSLALLDEILDPPGAPGLLLLATRRPLPGGARLLRPLPGVCRQLPLGGLSRAEGRALVALLGEPVPGADPERSIADEADGHPLFIQELVRHQAEIGVPARGGVRLDDALWSRINRLEVPARRLLEVTAVAGAPVPQHAVAHAAELDVVSSSKWVAQLRAAMLVRTTGLRGGDSIEPYHDRVRESVLSRVPVTRRRRYHALLADALEASGGARKDPLTLVRHLEAAGASERATELARRAAHQASEALAFDQAAELYAIALRLGSHPAAERRWLARRRAEALANAGRGPEAAEAYLEAAGDAVLADERFHLRRRAAEQFLVSGHLDRGMATLGSVLEEVGVHMPETPAAARRSLVWHGLRLRVRGLDWKPRAASCVPARELMRFDVYRSVSLGLAMVDSVLGADFQARALLLSLRLGDAHRVGHALAFQALYEGSQGGRRLARAFELSRSARAIAEAEDDAWLLAWTRGCQGILEYFAGRYRMASEYLAHAEAQFRDQTAGTTSELAHVRVFQLLALRRIGAFRELSAAHREYVRDAARRGDRYAETTFMRSSNIVWLAEDDPARARAELARTTWTPPQGGYHLQHWFDLRARVELALYEGAPVPDELEAEMAGFTRSQFARMQVLRAENEWMRGRAALVAGRRDDARRAARALRAEGAGYARAWGGLIVAALALAGRDVPAAVRHLQAAAQAADATDMPMVAAVARRRMGELAPGIAGHERVAAVDAWMAEQGVRCPAAMAGVIAPGF